MNFQDLMNIRAQWIDAFTANPSHVKRVGLTALTLLRLNPEQRLTDDQLSLLSAALLLTVRYDYHDQAELDDYSNLVTSSILGLRSNQTNNNPTSLAQSPVETIVQYFKFMREFLPLEQLQLLKPFNLLQRLAILKTEQKFAMLAHDERCNDLVLSRRIYEDISRAINNPLTGVEFPTLIGHLKSADAFDMIIKENETALDLAFKNLMNNTNEPITITSCIKLVLSLKEFLESNRPRRNTMARLIWDNIERLINNDLRNNQPGKIPAKLLEPFLKLFPRFRFLLDDNTRPEMLSVYRERNYIHYVIATLCQGARQSNSPLSKLPRLMLNHITMFASAHPFMNPQSSLAIATITNIPAPQVTADSSSSSSPSAAAGTRRAHEIEIEAQSTTAAKRARQ